MALKLLDADKLSEPSLTQRDAVILALHLIGMVVVMGLSAVAVFEDSTSYKYVSAAGITLLTLGYIYVAKREANRMEEFVKSVMIRVTLASLLYCILWTIFMSLWVFISKPESMHGMVLLFVAAMPWIGGGFGYWIARVSFRKLAE